MAEASALARYQKPLTQCFLFSGLPFEEIQTALGENFELNTFSAQQIIYEPEHFKRCIGIVLQGQALVYTPDASSNQPVLLNRFMPSQSFGVAALFGSEEPYVSLIKAKGRCTVLFLSEETLLSLLKQDFRMVTNYITFLSQRICFLNRKILSFTLSSCEEKLVHYLLQHTEEKDGIYRVDSPYSLTGLSQALHVSRASLYRAIEHLQQEGVLQKEGRYFLLPDPGKLRSGSFSAKKP